MYTAQLGLNHPIAIRYPRGRGTIIDWKQPFSKIEIGKAEVLQQGNQLAVLSLGTMAATIEECIDLNEKLKTISHVDMRFVKPLDEDLLHCIFKTHNTIITVEENAVKGGFGSAILEFAAEHNYKNDIYLKGIPDVFIEHGTVAELQESIGLDTKNLTKFILDKLD